MKGNKLSVILAVVFLAACSTPPQKLDPNKHYKRDLEFTAQGRTHSGVAVLARSASYRIELQAREKMNALILQTCHREEVFKPSEKRFTLDFKPTELETKGLSCLLSLHALNEPLGANQWALIEIEHPSLNLPAEILCNGQEILSTGASLCQTRHGLSFQIKFSERVIWPEASTCVKLKSEDEKTFEFSMPKGLCTLRFLAKEGAERYHRLTLFGYEALSMGGE